MFRQLLERFGRERAIEMLTPVIRNFLVSYSGEWKNKINLTNQDRHLLNFLIREIQFVSDPQYQHIEIAGQPEIEWIIEALNGEVDMPPVGYYDDPAHDELPDNVPLVIDLDELPPNVNLRELLGDRWF